MGGGCFPSGKEGSFPCRGLQEQLGIVLLTTQWVSHVPTAAGVCSSASAPIKTGWPQPSGILQMWLLLSGMVVVFWHFEVSGAFFICVPLRCVWGYIILRAEMKAVPRQEGAGVILPGLCLD